MDLLSVLEYVIIFVILGKTHNWVDRVPLTIVVDYAVNIMYLKIVLTHSIIKIFKIT